MVAGRRRLFILGLAIVRAAARPAGAVDRALLIGVAQYRSPEIGELAGVGLDLAAMRSLAQLLGYPKITLLADEQATLQNVRHYLADFLPRRVAPDDRVLIYFSLHGVRIQDGNGDETKDHQDEALALYDFSVETDPRSGSQSVNGVLVDDELGHLIGQLQAQSVLLIIDACHSGTATKGGPGPMAGSPRLQAKGLSWFDNLTLGEDLADWWHDGDLIRHAVVLSAAGDHESAYSSEQGSVFTLSLAHALTTAAEERQNLDPVRLRSVSETYIRTRLPAANRFQPQLHGADNLVETPLYLDPGAIQRDPALSVLRARSAAFRVEP